MDLLVAPSQTMKNWREQFGRMIIEAFACGVPVIGSDSGEIPFVIGDAGRVVAEADVAAWAETPSNGFWTARKERDELRNRGLARAPRYSVATIAKQYRRLLSLAGGPVSANGCQCRAAGSRSMLNHWQVRKIKDTKIA